MSGWPRIYYKLLNLPLSILVKSKSIPADPDPAPELGPGYLSSNYVRFAVQLES